MGSTGGGDGTARARWGGRRRAARRRDAEGSANPPAWRWEVGGGAEIAKAGAIVDCFGWGRLIILAVSCVLRIQVACVIGGIPHSAVGLSISVRTPGDCNLNSCTQRRVHLPTRSRFRAAVLLHNDNRDMRNIPWSRCENRRIALLGGAGDRSTQSTFSEDVCLQEMHASSRPRRSWSTLGP